MLPLIVCEVMRLARSYVYVKLASTLPVLFWCCRFVRRWALSYVYAE